MEKERNEGVRVGEGSERDRAVAGRRHPAREDVRGESSKRERTVNGTALTAWPRLRQRLRDDLSADDFRDWIRPLQVVHGDDGKLVLGAPTSRIAATLEESFRPAIDAAVEKLAKPGFQVDITYFNSSGEALPPPAKRKAPTRAKPAGRKTRAARKAAIGVHDIPAGAPLHPQYRFQSFVIGKSNRFACACAEAVAAYPGEHYNPLFLYGGVGLGKTHLLNAIGNRLRDTKPGMQVVYLAAENFVNEMIESIRNKTMPAFRKRYRNADVLLVDDIHFLTGKGGSQEEFFHTFNELYGKGRQIIVTSDVPPHDLRDIEERLRSRFQAGLLADIKPPELETRVAILQHKAQKIDHGSKLNDEVAHFLAKQARSNVRELKGLLFSVTAYAKLSNIKTAMIDVELAQEALSDVLPEHDRPLSASRIVKEVARHYGLKVSDIKSKTKSRQIVEPRQIAEWLCRQLTSLSYVEIGKALGGRHYSTVMHGVKKIEERRAKDERLAERLNRFRRQLERG